MASSYRLSRRDFLRTGGGSAAGFALSSIIPVLPSRGSELTPSVGTDADLLEVTLRAVPAEVSILPGDATRVWAYRGEVLQGDPAALQFLPDSYLGPVFRVHRGQNIRVHFTNELPQETIVHWHGLILPEAMDGHPRYAIAPGEIYTYDFQVNNRAGTYWYHPHPHGLTGQQVYNGLAGLFIVSDDEERAAQLPKGDYDIPLVIQDRTFDDTNQLVYLAGGMMTRMMTQMMGFLGDTILVNGKPNASLLVEAAAYRFRVLNGSNFRILKLAWDDGTPLTVIATDGGLLEAPAQRDFVVLSPGERVELWTDFSGKPLGSQIHLQSLPFEGVEMGGMMMDGMAMESTTTLPHGAEFTILQVNVESAATKTWLLPEHLSTIERPSVDDALNSAAPRTFEIAMINENWTINGRSFEMDAVAEDEIVSPNTLEVWEFVNVVNASGMGNMSGMNMGGNAQTGDQMAHPMHIHGVQFQVLERTIADGFAEGYDTIRGGYVDEGLKDTVLLMPGERVRLLVPFSDQAGKFVYHCHNLEHEDLGLMRNYEIRG